MRVPIVLVLAVAGLSLTAGAQETHKIRPPKPSRESRTARTSVPLRQPKTDDAISRQLRQTEQSGTKLGASKGVARQRRAPATLKATTEKPNPPIRFSSAASSGHAMQNNQGTNPYKGRLKQKHAGK